MTTLLAPRNKSFKYLGAKHLVYHSYVLRMWRQENCNTENPDWRFALEDVRTGNIIGFTSLESVFTTVSREIAVVETGV